MLSIHDVVGVECGPVHIMRDGIQYRTITVLYKGGTVPLSLVGESVAVRSAETAELHRRIADLEREVVRLRATLGQEVAA